VNCFQSCPAVLYSPGGRGGRPLNILRLNFLILRGSSSFSEIEPPDHSYRRHAPKVWQELVNIANGRSQVSGQATRVPPTPQSRINKPKPEPGPVPTSQPNRLARVLPCSWPVRKSDPEITASSGVKGTIACAINSLAERHVPAVGWSFRLQQGIQGNIDDRIKNRINNDGNQPDQQSLADTSKVIQAD